MVEVRLIEIVDTITENVQTVERYLKSKLIELLKSSLEKKSVMIIVQHSARRFTLGMKLIHLFPISLIID